MRILMISENYLPMVGGVTQHVSQLSGVLKKLGHEVQVFCLNKSEPKQIREDLIEEVCVLRFPTDPALFQAALLANQSTYQAVDVIHVHDFAMFLRFIAPVLLDMPELPVYLTFHGHEGQFPPSDGVCRIRKACKTLAHGTINIGRFIEKWYGTPADVTLYGGIDDALLAEADSMQSEPHFAYIGRFADDVPLDIYIDSVHLLRQRGIEATLTLCGDGPLKAEMVAKAQEYGIPTESLPMTYKVEEIRRRARFLFMGGYLSVLEGFAAGRIVVSAFHNAARESYVLQHPYARKLFLAEGSATVLAKRILSVLSNKSLARQLVSRGREVACENSWEKVAEAYIGIWGKVK